MYYFLLSIFLIVCLLLMVVILLQQSKGGGLSGAFGGMGGGDAMFGARGVTTFLHKATIYLGAAFMLISLVLALMILHRGAGTGSNLAGEAGRRAGDILQPPVVEDLLEPGPAGDEAGGPAEGEELVPPAPPGGEEGGQEQESGGSSGGN